MIITNNNVTLDSAVLARGFLDWYEVYFDICETYDECMAMLKTLKDTNYFGTGSALKVMDEAKTVKLDPTIYLQVAAFLGLPSNEETLKDLQEALKVQQEIESADDYLDAVKAHILAVYPPEIETAEMIAREEWLDIRPWIAEDPDFKDYRVV